VDLETKFFLYFFLACKRRFKRMNQEKLEKYKQTKAQDTVKYITKKSQFFKKYYENYNLDDVWNLPTVNKQIMMDNLTKYNTAGLKKQELVDFCLNIEETQNFDERFGKYNVAMSSGTSGNIGIVITSPSEERYLRAAFFARFSFPRTLRLNIAFILRVTTPAFQIDKFGQKLTHISQLNPIVEITRQLQELQPNVLSAPPSMLQILAKEINEDRLKISPPRVVSFAEILYPEVEEELEEVFGCKIHQIYQASEGPIAMSCKDGSLHINEDLIQVQALNADGTPTNPGETCYKMIVTDLHRKIQPIIRYELNDLIIISQQKCSCGSSFRVIEQIQGRTDDLLWSHRTDSGELQFIFPDYLRRAIIASSEDIEEYQVIQKSFTKLLVRLLLKSEDCSQESIIRDIKIRIGDVFKSYSCEKPEITVVFEKAKLNSISQKLVRIQRDFKVDI
jgi:putative adenylate-forming enzyme